MINFYSLAVVARYTFHNAKLGFLAKRGGNARTEAGRWATAERSMATATDRRRTQFAYELRMGDMAVLAH